MPEPRRAKLYRSTLNRSRCSNAPAAAFRRPTSGRSKPPMPASPMASTAQDAVSTSRSIMRSRWRRRPRPGAGKGTLFPRHALGRIGREKDMRYRILMLFPLLALGACGDRPADPRGVEHDETLLSVSATGRSERSEEHTSELQSLMRISYAVFCLKKKKPTN